MDLFGTKLLRPDLSWDMYTSKIDSLSESSLRAVCATREGTILRLFRLAETSWIGSGTISLSAFRDNLEDVLEQSGIDSGEAEFIADEVHAGYPWLDSIYEENAV